MSYSVRKTLNVLKVFLVVGAALCALLCQHHTRRLLWQARRLERAVREWRLAGPHTTHMGRLRERLASTGWLAPPRDTLRECGVPLGGEWIFNADGCLSCMAGAVRQARDEHCAFRKAILVVLATLVAVTVMADMRDACTCLLLHHPASLGTVSSGSRRPSKLLRRTRRR